MKTTSQLRLFNAHEISNPGMNVISTHVYVSESLCFSRPISLPSNQFVSFLELCTSFSSLRQSETVICAFGHYKRETVESCKQPKLTNQQDTLNLYDSTRNLENNFDSSSQNLRACCLVWLEFHQSIRIAKVTADCQCLLHI